MEAILNLLLAFVAIGIIVVWIKALGDWDGKCHYEDCSHCPFDGDCPMQKGRFA